jgi:hypothetical protein
MIVIAGNVRRLAVLYLAGLVRVNVPDAQSLAALLICPFNLL